MPSVFLVGGLILCAPAHTVGTGQDQEAKSASASTLVYVGTLTGDKGKGIYLFRLQTENLEVSQNITLVPLGLAAETPNPTFLDLDIKRRLLFAVNEIDEFDGKPSGAVSAFSIEAASGKLTLLNQRASLGARPCQLILEKDARNATVKAGITMDQVLANQLGQETPHSSVVLACEQPMTGYHETNFSMAYSSHISWQSAESPVPNEVYPSLAFDNLFDNRGSLRYQSILDKFRERASSLSRSVSTTDRYKLDEYLTSVREVEKRIEKMRESRTRPTSDRRRPAVRSSRWNAPRTGCPKTYASTRG